MVTQVQAITRRDSADIANRFRDRAAELRERVGHGIADVVIANSPVDSGTYIMAHRAGPGPSDAEADRSSRGKIRGRSRSQFAGLARNNLYRSVSSAAVANASEIWFTNSALHAARVEWLGWDAPLFGNPGVGGRGPYNTYAIARASAPQIIRDVAREMGMQAR